MGQRSKGSHCLSCHAGMRLTKDRKSHIFQPENVEPQPLEPPFTRSKKAKLNLESDEQSNFNNESQEVFTTEGDEYTVISLTSTDVQMEDIGINKCRLDNEESSNESDFENTRDTDEDSSIQSLETLGSIIEILTSSSTGREDECELEEDSEDEEDKQNLYEQHCKAKNTESHKDWFTRSVCRNCYRSEHNAFRIEDYHVKLISVDKADISCRGHWKSFVKSDLERSSRFVKLCECCHVLLRKGNNARKKEWRYVWPIYIWLVISNEKVLETHGADVLKMIPLEWHVYWSEALTTTRPDIFSTETFKIYEEGTPVTIDVTENRNNFLCILDRNRLGEIKTGCNKYLMPTVLCPWGCTSYAFHKGYMTLDAVYSRFVPEVPTTGVYETKAKVQKARSCRNDFFF